MNSLSFGVMAGGANADVAYLESLPIDSLWVGGHVASPNPSPEAMVALAWLAARTERVRVGTAVLLLPLYPPAIVAKQIADLDRATGGRVTLGVGVGGEYPGEFRACQVPIAERGPRTDEAIPLLRRLWSGEHGQPRRAASSRWTTCASTPPPVQPGGVPIVVAGRQPVAMRRAALPRRRLDAVPLLAAPLRRVGRRRSARSRPARVATSTASSGSRSCS